jgi:LacI family transcriptional regulator
MDDAAPTSAVTLAQLAQEAGVSVGTVSRVLNGKNKETWQSTSKRAEHIRAIARARNYRPHAAARAMRGNKTMTVGVLIRNNPAQRFVASIETQEALLGISEVMEEAGYLVSIIRIEEVAKGLCSESRIFREHVVDGIIVAWGLSQSVEAEVEALVPHCIWMDCNTWRPRRCLRRDERAAGQMAAQALVDLGYRKLIWYAAATSNWDYHYSYTHRLAGVMEVADRLGLQVEVVDRTSDQLYRTPEVLQRWFRPEVGLITYNSYNARWLSHTAAGMGLCPGYDFGIVSCDDTRDTAVRWPGLSRARYDRLALGRKAAEMMIALLENPQAPCPSQIVASRWLPGNSAWGPRSFRADATPSTPPEVP